MAVPTMPDSASGVSMTRSSPKSFWSPSVTRKTPPSLPTSSPMIRTLGSLSSAVRSDALIALESDIFWAAISDAFLSGDERSLVRGELRPLLVHERMAVGVGVLEHRHVVGVGHRPDRLPHPLGERVGLLFQTVEERLVREPLVGEKGAQPQDRVLGLPQLALLGRAVAC